MKHHDLKNKILFEKLAKQYSKGEVEEGLWDTLKKRAQKEFGPTAQNTDPMEDPVYSDLMKRMDQMDASKKTQVEKGVEDAMAAKKKEISNAANEILVLLDKAGIPKNNEIYKNLYTSMQGAMKALEADVQQDDFSWPEPPSDEEKQ